MPTIKWGDLSLIRGLIGTSWKVNSNQWQIEKNYMAEVEITKKKSIHREDYKKVCNTSPLSWVLECADIPGISDQIKTLLEETKLSRRVKLICGDKLLEKVNMERDIFQRWLTFASYLCDVSDYIDISSTKCGSWLQSWPENQSLSVHGRLETVYQEWKIFFHTGG